MNARVLLLFGFIFWGFSPLPALAGPLFSDGLLGLTQEELRAKLGPPQKVRERGAALRVFKYYPLEEWENVMKDQLPDAMGEDVYLYVRDKVNVRYSFQFAAVNKPHADTPTFIVKMVEIEFLTPDSTGSVEGPVGVPLAVQLEKIPSLVPEFKPSPADDAPTFRSNLFVIFIQNETSPDARRLVKDRHRDDYPWSLSYRLYTTEVIPARLSLSTTMIRMEITVDSEQLMRDHNKLTHEAVLNPYSAKAASLPEPAAPQKKKIPMPHYAP
jgi:hypothetical protein